MKQVKQTFEQIYDTTKTKVTFGVILIAFSCLMLAIIENVSVDHGDAVEDLKGGNVDIVEVGDIDSNDAKKFADGDVIHAYGMVNAKEELTDEKYGVTAKGIRLIRYVWYYQVVEEEIQRRDASGEVTKVEYRYHTQWSDKKVDPSSLRDIKQLGRNYVIYDESEEEIRPEQLYFGENLKLSEEFAFYAGSELVPCEVVFSPEVLDAINEEAAANYRPDPLYPHLHEGSTSDSYVHIRDNEIYVGRDPKKPEIGDVKISFMYMPAYEATAFGKVEDNTLVTYKHGSANFTELPDGKVPMGSILNRAEEDSIFGIWLYRIIFYFLMMWGFKLLGNMLPVKLGRTKNLYLYAEYSGTALAWLLPIAICCIIAGLSTIGASPTSGTIFLVFGIAVLVALPLMKLDRRRVSFDTNEVSEAERRARAAYHAQQKKNEANSQQ